MNPIEKALDTADKVIAANRELERISANPHLTVISHNIPPVPVRRLVSFGTAVAKAKEEVRDILANGVQTSRGFERPTREDIKGFGDLHDYTDANVLGYLCDDDVDFVSEETLDIIDRSTDEGNAEWFKFGVDLQDVIDEWIKNGFAEEGSRSYVLGLPVVITVHSDGHVTAEVDLSEADDIFGNSCIGQDDSEDVLIADKEAISAAVESKKVEVSL